MGEHLVRFSVSCLNQWALDFTGNLRRIRQSIVEAKKLGARYRSGPELEICGYSCEDHFYERDTELHSWQVLSDLLGDEKCRDIIVDVGMPCSHKNVVYNCRVVFLNSKILLIRPKKLMCDDDIYRESRYFSAWSKSTSEEGGVEEHTLPSFVTEITGQTTCPFGDGVLQTADQCCIGYEICEELWNPRSSHIDMGLDGVHVFVNSSGSYTQLRKCHVSFQLSRDATTKSGGLYLFSNLRGCDGQRTYFNGCSSITLNGNLLVRCRQFDLSEVEVVAATVDLNDVESYRNRIRSRQVKASEQRVTFTRIHVDFSVRMPSNNNAPSSWVSKRIKYMGPSPDEEIAYGPACWLWDYLRRSGQAGFFLPLSGGVDSSSTACIVYSMCRLVYDACGSQGTDDVLRDLRRILHDSHYTPSDPQDICYRLLTTCYMATSNSSQATKHRAEMLASQIGCRHMTMSLDSVISAVLNTLSIVTNGFVPKYKVDGGSECENLALQNLQARLRMVFSYLLAQISHWCRGSRNGNLLVLGSSNVDECLRGYMTKYDCSSADINPIGSISKTDLKHFLRYASDEWSLSALSDILEAPPTAELEPLGGDGQVVQRDEDDMGMTYDELSLYGRLRKQENCGPYSMFCKLLHIWKTNGGDSSKGGGGAKNVVVDPSDTAEKVKRFFRFYAINRHKMTVLTPSYHAESYSPDDNRFDHRPFLYNVKWNWQFNEINKHVSRLKK